MDKTNYLMLLENRHKRYFDVYRNYEIRGKSFDLYAECHVRTERTILGYALDAYEAHDYRMLKCYDRPSLSEIVNLYNWITLEYDNWVNPKENHMCTFLTLVVVLSKGASRELVRFVEGIKHGRHFKFGLRGWYELRFLLVDLSNERVRSNVSGRQIKEDFIIKPEPKSFLKKIFTWR